MNFLVNNLEKHNLCSKLVIENMCNKKNYKYRKCHHEYLHKIQQGNQKRKYFVQTIKMYQDNTINNQLLTCYIFNNQSCIIGIPNLYWIRKIQPNNCYNTNFKVNMCKDCNSNKKNLINHCMLNNLGYTDYNYNKYYQHNNHLNMMIHKYQNLILLHFINKFLLRHNQYIQLLFHYCMFHNYFNKNHNLKFRCQDMFQFSKDLLKHINYFISNFLQNKMYNLNLKVHYKYCMNNLNFQLQYNKMHILNLQCYLLEMLKLDMFININSKEDKNNILICILYKKLVNLCN